MIQQVKELVLKDIRLNWRERYALYSMLLYVVSTSYVAYLSFEGIISDNSWIALFWIIVLFAAMNASLQSFKRELNEQALFFYTLAKPRAIILSKTIYNSGLLVFLTLISYCIYSLFLGNPITAHLSFILCIILGSSAIASTLTLVAAIASKTNNSSGLMAVLSIPLLFPLLLNLIKTSKLCLNQDVYFFAGSQLLFLALLNIVSVLLSYLLFPYLWRD
tara:strand:- start:13371 stop:14027 length:657 start_codon:yes stop_codon:yes gene_type:complete